ncbi:unnamed protein product [Diatraea saccharalis]|uniref:Uncharacterized protein n=1 Tax=Diatraea saccharalis TaxID=40085 RepID=A0A9P0G013_9NEOP|nr:unnamed protein product [Diatraea saccharalis]
MEFDAIVVKESPGLCRCCLSEGCYKDMGTEYAWMNETEVYADMLLECFDISISQINDGPNGPNRLICEVCITRLRDACYFKKQVLDTEKKFVDMVGRGDFRPKVLYQSNMKTETCEAVVVSLGADDGEVEYLDDEMDYEPDTLKEEGQDPEPTVSADPLPIRGKRGRPKKSPTKPEKKKVKVETKAKSSKALVKGAKHLDTEATSKSSMTSTKRNRLMKKNAITVLENSKVTPFKWHRQNFLCFFCHLPFKDAKLLREHTKNLHKKSSIKSAVSYLRRDEKVKIDVSSLQCKCGHTFDSLDSLIEHIRVLHKCCFTEVCGYGLIPYKLDLEGDSFRCAVCAEQFQYFIKLNQHMNEHYGNYVCESCGKSFLSQDRLRCHALVHGARFRCNICSETFDSLTQRNNHESKVHNKVKELKCFFCPETFSNYNVRKRHHNSIHNLQTPEFKCPDCGKSFHIMSKMKVHLKEVHIKEKNFSCTVCEQKFFSKTHVQKHMIKHFGERVYQCSVCMKSYGRKQTLRDHMRIHNNEKRFVCAVCSESFVQNSNLTLHIKVHHPESANV